MKTWIQMLIILGTLLVWNLRNAEAEMISGAFTNQFDDPLNIWDPSGNYSDELSGFDGMTINYSMNADAAGKLSGGGGFEYDDGWDYLSGDFSLSGSMKGSGGVVRLSLVISMNGSGMIYDYEVDFSAKAKQNLEIDPYSREMYGTMAGKVTVGIPSLGRQKSESLPKSEIALALPEDAGGVWKLSLDLHPTAKTYSGSGAVELSNGRIFPLTVTGSYSDKKDTSSLLLDGSQALAAQLSKAIKFTLVTAGTNGTMTIRSLKGNTLGQKLQMKN